MQFDEDDIEFGKVLHTGGQARIYLARSISLDETVIAKEFICGDVDKEIRIKQLKHENIVKFIGNIQDRPRTLIYEYVSKGDLDTIITKDYELLKRNPLKHVEGILKGMKYIHDNNIVHLDLHSKNILVHMGNKNELIMKICDFGLSEEQKCGCFPEFPLGRPGYVSPEKINGGEINVDTDVWSFAAILWKLLTKQEAYNYDNPHAAYYNIGSNRHPDVPIKWPVLIQKLFFQCWDSRKNTTELLNLFSNNRIKRDTDQTLSYEMPLNFYDLYVTTDANRVVPSIEWGHIDKKAVFRKYLLDKNELQMIKMKYKSSICRRKFKKIVTMMDLLHYLNEQGIFTNLETLNHTCIGKLCSMKSQLSEKAELIELIKFARYLGMPDDDIATFTSNNSKEAFVNEIFEFWSLSDKVTFDIDTFYKISKHAGIKID